ASSRKMYLSPSSDATRSRRSSMLNFTPQTLSVDVIVEANTGVSCHGVIPPFQREERARSTAGCRWRAAGDATPKEQVLQSLHLFLAMKSLQLGIHGLPGATDI